MIQCHDYPTIFRKGELLVGTPKAESTRDQRKRARWFLMLSTLGGRGGSDLIGATQPTRNRRPEQQLTPVIMEANRQASRESQFLHDIEEAVGNFHIRIVTSTAKELATKLSDSSNLTFVSL